MRSCRFDQTRLKQALFYTLLFSLMAHAYMYFSLALTHDALLDLVPPENETGFQLSLGRFMEPVYWLFRGRLAPPWLVGMLSIAFLSVSVYLIFLLLDIRDRFCIILLCGIFSTNYTLIAANATYSPWVDMYMLALLLVCTGVYLWERSPRWGAAAAAPLFCVSMGLYQAYIDVAIGLALILLIRRTMEGEDGAAFWRRAARYAASLLAGAILYYLIMKLSLLLSGQALGESYNSPSHVLDSDLRSLLRLIPGAYFDFAAFFFSPLRAHNTPFVSACRGLLGLAGLVLWGRSIRRAHLRGAALVRLGLCAALLPLGLNFVYVLSAGFTHDLMVFADYLVYIVLLLPLKDLRPAAPGDDAGERPAPLLRAGILAVCGCLVFHNIVFANGAYLYKRLVYESAGRYAFSVWTELERREEYEPGVTPVAIVGNFIDSRMSRDTFDFPLYADMTGMWSDTSTSAFIKLADFRQYLRVVLGHSVNLVDSQEEMERLAGRADVQAMPIFPKDGYCRMIDGVMVVKLSGLP